MSFLQLIIKKVMTHYFRLSLQVGEFMLDPFQLIVLISLSVMMSWWKCFLRRNVIVHNQSLFIRPNQRSYISSKIFSFISVILISKSISNAFQNWNRKWKILKIKILVTTPWSPNRKSMIWGTKLTSKPSPVR